VEQLHGFLTTDMKRAVEHLAQIVKALDAYADVLPPSGSPASSTPAPASEEPGEKGSPA